MNRELTQRSCTAICVPLCLEGTAGTNRGAVRSQGVRAGNGFGGTFRNGHPNLHCHRPAVYMQRPVGKWLK
ncbi:unnamed protein product [Staurois parvus]|uniref:Secreted protein n=1 Tax=Staurois parvus TaxID=386267 RepID=A0ABN9D7I0_9NEOB|nr:unnamed protein product [Staurois parvus]